MRDRRTEMEASEKLRETLNQKPCRIIIPRGDGTFMAVNSVDVVEIDEGEAVLLG